MCDLHVQNIEPTYDPETKIVSGGPEIYVPDPKGLGHAYFMQMKRNKRKIAQINAETGEKETFESLLKRSINTAIGMQIKGITPGDIVAICSVNNTDNIVPFIAAQMVGAIVASFDPTIPPSDTEHLIKQVYPKLIFVSIESEKLIEDALTAVGWETIIVVFGDSNKYEKFSDFSAYKDEDNCFEPYEVDDINRLGLIVFSSGTTGLSKGICITQYAQFYQAHTFSTTGSDYSIYLSFASTYWISTVLILNVMIMFGKTRLIAKFNPKTIWNLIDEFKVTFLFLAPTHAMFMIKSGRPDIVNTTSLRDVLIGGGPLTKEYNLMLKDLLPGTFVHLAYGQSESSGVVTNFRTANRRDVFFFHKKPTSCGRPLIGFKYKIVDPETEEVLGPNQPGELYYHAKCITIGYYNMDSSNAFDENGWIKSGDVVYYDDDFCFYIVDRLKEMLKYQSFHVHPAKIERVLLSHPHVKDAVVIGIPDDEDGDHPMGVVILEPDATVTPEELTEYVNDRVDFRSLLRAGVKIVDIFPYTPSGKVKKNVLKNMVLSGEL